MIHEIRKLLRFGKIKLAEGRQLAIATIIHTVGSSYRKTGTQMMVADDLSYEGAISGGCIEKEVVRQSLSVFNFRQSAVFEYDGRYKLGCNGRIYIVVEFVDAESLQLLSEEIDLYHSRRDTFHLGIRRNEALTSASTYFSFHDGKISLCSFNHDESENTINELEIQPQNQLIIFGGEYDSIVLASLADQCGFDTTLFVKERFDHALAPSIKVTYSSPEAVPQLLQTDERTALVLMTHSLSRDLHFLEAVLPLPCAYLGLLGPSSRRQTMLNDLWSYNESLFLNYDDKIKTIHGPIGISIGAKTPEEISIAVLAEVTGVLNGCLAVKPETFDEAHR
jgi:xanthine dehydrogenase accessory factor